MDEPSRNAVTSLLSGDVAERVKQLELFCRLRVEGSRSGENKAKQIGFSTDFAQHRQYFPGDNLRHLDWRVLARTDRLVVKQHEDLTNAEMAVLLDASGSMAFAGQGMSKLEFAVRCAAILTYLMCLQGDSFSLYLFSESAADHVPRGSGRRHLRRVFEKLVSVPARGETRFAECFREVEARLTRKGLVAALSDFMAEPEPIARSLGRLRMRGHDVIAFHVFDPDEREMDFVELTRFRDLEDGSILAADPLLIQAEYRKQFDQHQLMVKKHCLAHAVDHVVLPVADEYDEVIGGYLRRRAALMS
jgi:uncharacterized protein (DUF58 family)